MESPEPDPDQYVRVTPELLEQLAKLAEQNAASQAATAANTAKTANATQNAGCLLGGCAVLIFSPILLFLIAGASASATGSVVPAMVVVGLAVIALVVVVLRAQAGEKKP
jgi:hypothetical protein